MKATSLLAVAAIWGASIGAVAAQREAWWALIFAALASAAVGLGIGRAHV